MATGRPGSRRLENIDWDRAIIRGWQQPKKHGAPRDMAIHGWDVQDISDLLDDDPKVVEGSYLDKSWLKTVGRKARRGERYPKVEWVRPEGARSERDPSIPGATKTPGRGL